MKKIKILSLLFAALFVFTACQNYQNLRITENGALFNKATGKYYYPCSASIGAFELNGKCAKVGNEYFYKIKHEETEDFISDEFKTGGVYRGENVPEITLENFKAVAAKIYVVGELDILIDEFMVSKDLMPPDIQPGENYVDGTEYTNAVVDAILNGENLPVPIYIDNAATVHIRLLSSEYEGLTYTVIFMMDINGDCYLYDRGASKCVEAPKIIVKRYVGLLDDENSDTENSGVDSTSETESIVNSTAE